MKVYVIIFHIHLFMCGILRLFAARVYLTPLSLTGTSGSCPSGWSDSGIYCYRLTFTNTTWSNGNTDCESLHSGATLAKMASLSEYEYLYYDVL